MAWIHPRNDARAGAAAAIIAMAVAGCSGGPTIVVATSAGVTPLNAPAPPPPFAPPFPPGAGSLAARSGTYTGTAVPLDTGAGLCTRTLNVSGFRVHGNKARFGPFRGTIAPDNGLQMVNGQEWIIGQFDGPTFHGQFDIPGRFGGFGCSYVLNLERTGA